MAPGPVRETARYAAFAQVGFEMVAPIVLGVWLDQRYGWLPWCTVAGVVLGFVGGFMHLFVLLKRFNEDDAPKRAKR